MIFDGVAVVYLLIGICCLLFVSLMKKSHGIAHLPPGPRPLPLIGNLHQIKTSQMVASLKELSEKYGPVYTLHLGLQRVVILWGYDAVKEALVDQGEEFSGRGSTPTFEAVFKDFGVTTANGKRWKELRRFSILTLRNFGMGKRSIEERIQEEAQHLIAELRNTKESPFDPTLQLSNATSNIICSIVFGNRFDYEDKEFLEIIGMVNDVFVLASSLCGQVYSMFSHIMDYLPGPHNKIYQKLCCLEKFIERRVKMNLATLDPSAPRDFIDCFLIKMEKEKQNPETEYFMKTLVISALGLFMAGTETVSTTIRHGLLLLLKYPEIEERILAEIDCVIGRNRIPSIEDRIKMPYTEAVLNEIQRFISILPFGAPHSVIRDTKFRGFMLPKGNGCALVKGWL